MPDAFTVNLVSEFAFKKCYENKALLSSSVFKITTDFSKLIWSDDVLGATVAATVFFAVLKVKVSGPSLSSIGVLENVLSVKPNF